MTLFSAITPEDVFHRVGELEKAVIALYWMGVVLLCAVSFCTIMVICQVILKVMMLGKIIKVQTEVNDNLKQMTAIAAVSKQNLVIADIQKERVLESVEEVKVAAKQAAAKATVAADVMTNSVEQIPDKTAVKVREAIANPDPQWKPGDPERRSSP